MKRVSNFFIAITLLAFGCEQPPASPIELLVSPAAENSNLPRLVTSPEGVIFMSWVEKGDDKSSSLMYSSLQGQAWTDSKQIAKGSNWFVNWADFPSVVVNGDQLGAHWLQKSDLGTYDYDVRVSISQDGGANWGESFIPHKDSVAAEHGFVSMLPMEDQKTFITWLDGRNTKSTGHHEGEHGGSGAMTLRAGIFDKNGETLSEWELDHRICDCCQTGAAMTSNGPVVVYRDRSENEIRDMAIVRYVDGAWTKPMPLAIELWEIAGCPVNGPAVVAKEKLVAATWFTAKDQFPQVKMAVSNDAGENFGEAITVSEGITSGRVGITLLADESIVVSYLDNHDGRAHLMVAHYNRSGMFLNKVKVAETSMERASGFPVITSNDEQLIMAWTEVGEKTIVKTAQINL